MSLRTWFNNTFIGAGNAVAEEQGDGSWFYFMQGQNIDIPFKTAFEFFKGIPQLRAVIEKKVSFFANARFYLAKLGTDEEVRLPNHEFNERLTNPNAFQSWKQMLCMIGLYKYIAGVAFVYPSFGISLKPKYITSLKPIDFDSYTPENSSTTLNALTTDNFDEIVKKYTFWMKNGQALHYKPSDLITIKDTFISYTDNYSHITTLINNDCLPNIYKQMVARGIMIDKQGGIGLISGNQKDGGVSVPWDKKEKESMKKNLNKYGLGKNKEPIMLTDVPLKYTPMVFPTRELMLFEEGQDDFNQICDEYGMARELFVGDASYAATREQAEADTYSNTIMPEWEDLFDLLNDGLNTKAEGFKICLDTSHIACLQRDEKEEIANDGARSARLISELDKGIITIDEYRQQMGYEKRKTA